MNLKYKIVAYSFAVMLTITSLVIGVFAFDIINFKFSGDIVYSSAVSLLYDSTNNYYYVEMGNYSNSAIRWKYVGYYEEDKCIASNNPLKGQQAIFVQQTYNDDTKIFDADGKNDYATSSIRKYLTSEDYLTSLGITSNNQIYKKIKSRSIKNQYINIEWDWSSGLLSTGITSSRGEDKFWLMSLEEVFILIGQGSYAEENNIYKNWDNTVTNNLIYNSTIYWLRSPYFNSSNSVYSIYSGGHWDNEITNDTRATAVRPAFFAQI